MCDTLEKIHWIHFEDSKMVAKGRKQKATFLQWNLGETLETHFAGKITEKRQNLDPSTTPASSESPAPRWLGKSQTRWASWYHGTPTDKPGPEQHSPWTDRPPPGKKEKRVINNKNNKDTWERGWGALSTKDWGKGIHPGTVNKQAGKAGEAPAGAGAHAQQPGAGKLVRMAEGGKLHRRGGKTHFPHEL
jgi:hypothetical protein